MRGTSQASRSLILFALLHGLLYCSLLPLWEGYDEPFHYGYVKYLVSERRFPVADRSVLDEEIWRSMHLAPTSYMNARNSPGLMPYIDYFALEETARREMRGRLFSLPTDFSAAKTGPNNYEAQQPPLAYLSLAAVEWATRGVALPWRVYILRLLGTFASLAILIYATTRLGQAMGIESAYLGAAIFMLLATQGLYGAVAHIANDWLAVALFPVLFLAAERFRQ
jgi:hypothetical protein